MMKTVLKRAFLVPSSPFRFPDVDSAAPADGAQDRRLSCTVVASKKGKRSGEGDIARCMQKRKVERIEVGVRIGAVLKVKCTDMRH